MRRRDPARRGGGALRLGLILAFGVVGFEHAVHTLLGHGDSAGSHLLHALRDGWLALPVAVVAACAGRHLATRSARRRGASLSPIECAAAISLVFTALMVPSALVHERTHGDAGPAHAPAWPAMQSAGAEHPRDVPRLVHAIRDALIGQIVAFPIAMLGLGVLAGGRRRPRMGPRNHGVRPLARTGVALGAVVAASVGGPFGATAALALDADPCGSDAPERSYDVSAINVRIQYDTFGDHDPRGFMYVMDERIAAVREQEAAKQVSTGLRKDPIQPLVIRANLGECLVVNFTNRLTAGPKGGAPPRASIHAHGLPYRIEDAGSVVGENADSMAAPGEGVTYRFSLGPHVGEGGHVFHSHGDDRQTTAHGLFGAIVAEPAGSAFLDPENGQPLASGWEAIVQPADGPSFREFAIIYHEVGDEQFSLKDAAGASLSMVDSALSGAYRPGTRALNYRSEPFMRRLELQQQLGLQADKSQAYGSYAFGDPATPIARSYLGEPTKTRLLHAGSEMAHVHHLHGGATRWRRNPGADDTDMAGGLRKVPIQSARSIRLDSQLISPSEAYELEHECGAGGCQQAAGDFLFHCHIAHHYVAGMWGFWRVFDTLQPDLAVLPDLAPPPEAVDSAGLLGRVIEGETVVLARDVEDRETQQSLEQLVERQLPPRGVRAAQEDATVWDWIKGGTRNAPAYLGEPDDTRTWANYASATPGDRPAILFNPLNGRPAWPLLRPHLGMRPPFAPGGHGGAPWLGDTGGQTRPDGLCPAGAPRRTYDVTAITLPIQETDAGGVDQDGQIFVLSEDKAAVLAGTKPAEPLAIRSNVGDCVALTLTSQLVDNFENGQHSKVNMHTHFVQFDPQASDGVITGLSYEQSVRPFPTEARALVAPAFDGDRTIVVAQASGLRPGIAVAIGQGEPNIEVRKIRRIETIAGAGDPAVALTLDEPLARAHVPGESVGVEFVQYRWFSDVDSGTVFWHDHVDGIVSWDHGLFGAHIIEPPGSTYHDPRTGAQVRSGAIVDVHTDGSVGAGQAGSFREFMIWLHNDVRTTLAPNGTGKGSINLRAEPFVDRSSNADPHVLSSVRYGDPFTPLPRAYVGDPFVIRTIGVVEKEGALRVTGHRFRPERFAAEGELTDAATTGISERFDYVLDGGAGGPAGTPGDYLYYSTVQREFESGAWGILRVHDTLQPGLEPLPDRPAPAEGEGFPALSFTGGAPPPAGGPGQPCPAGAPSRTYDAAIFAKPLPITNHAGQSQDAAGVIYALSADRQAILDGTKPVEPLVVRANAGDCVEITLTNHLTTRASLSLGKLLFDPLGSYGAAIGLNPDSTVAPGASYTYRFYADRELGTSLWLNLGNPSTLIHGAFGALVVEPAGSTYLDPATGEPLASGPRAMVRRDDGSFREFVALFHDADAKIGQSGDPLYPDGVKNFAGLNYRSAPLASRLAANPDGSRVFSSDVHGDPSTTLMRAYVGDPVRFRVAVPAAEQFHVFAVEGHRWPWEPALAGSALLDSRSIGPGESLDAVLDGGAGGPLGVAGDYLYLDHRFPFTRAGLWGILRVHGSAQPDLPPLEEG